LGANDGRFCHGFRPMFSSNIVLDSFRGVFYGGKQGKNEIFEFEKTRDVLALFEEIGSF
jgi:hypothetical protein